MTVRSYRRRKPVLVSDAEFLPLLRKLLGASEPVKQTAAVADTVPADAVFTRALLNTRTGGRAWRLFMQVVRSLPPPGN